MQAKFGLLLVILISIVAIGWIDLVTGPAYGLSLFYLCPVIGAGWYLGRGYGALAAVAAATMWTASEVATAVDRTEIATAWNGFTRLVIYLGFSVGVAILRADRTRLRELLAAAETSARTDALTGLANSRAFYERLREEMPRLARSGRTIVIAYIDVDNFKRVNDRFGHSKGDEVLTEIAGVLRSIVRAGDLPARLGGDEFALALWDTTRDKVAEVEARLAAGLEPLTTRYADTGLGASVGIAELGPGASIDDVVRAADEAMYAAKAARKAKSAQS